MVRTGTRIRSGWLRTDALGSQRWCHCSRPTLMLITCLSTSSAAVHSCHIGWNAAQHFSRHCCLQGRQSAGRARHALAQTPRHTLRCARALLRECTRLVARLRENTLHHHTDLYHNISGTKSMDDTSSRASQRAGRSARDHTRQRSTSFVQPQVCGLCVHCLPSLSALLIESPALQRWCGPQTWSSSAVC